MTSTEQESSSSGGEDLHDDDLKVVYQIAPQVPAAEVLQPPGAQRRPRYKIPPPPPEYLQIHQHKARKRHKKPPSPGTCTPASIVAIVLLCLVILAEATGLMMLNISYTKLQASQNYSVKQQQKTIQQKDKKINELTRNMTMCEIQAKQIRITTEGNLPSKCVCPTRNNSTEEECETNLSNAREQIGHLESNNTDLVILLSEFKRQHDDQQNHMMACSEGLAGLSFDLQQCRAEITNDSDCEIQLYTCQSKTCIGWKL